MPISIRDEINEHGVRRKSCRRRRPRTFDSLPGDALACAMEIRITKLMTRQGSDELLTQSMRLGGPIRYGYWRPDGE